MRLLHLRLQNFRQHGDTRIQFRRGLTGIIGPNGAGKTTILEAIAWAIYGASAARGTNDTIRFSRAPGRAKVLVDLGFELGGHEFRVNRSLSGADVYIDGGLAPVATGTGGVSAYLESRIGMSRDEFFNTYFTSQKELQFLAQMGPTARARFLAQVLGYERLRDAQDRLKERRNHIRAEIMGIREVLPDPEELAAKKEEAEQRSKNARSAYSTAERDRVKRAAQLEELQPRWLEVQQKKERIREVGHEIEAAHRDGDTARREVDRVNAELQRIKEAEEQLEPLREQLKELETVARECERFAQLRVTAERRRVLEETEKEAAAEIEGHAARLKELASAPELLTQHSTELERVKEQLSVLEAQLTQLRNDWTENRQDVRTKLQNHLERYDELKNQIEQLRSAGPDGTCPICTRPLGKEFDKVVGLLEEQFEEVQQNGKWLRKRSTQLEKKPEDLVAAEEQYATLQKSLETHTQLVARCEQAVQEIWTLTNDRQKKQQRVKELRAELKKLPAGYDPALHKKADARLKELREIEQRAARFEQVLEARPQRNREFSEATSRAKEALARLEAAAARLEEIAFDPKQFEQLGAQYEQATKDLHAADLALTDTHARLEAARDHLARVKDELRVAEENRARLHELEVDVKHHVELDNALAELRAELNARLRPELSDLASIFLNDVTDGRYSALEIDENYNVVMLDEGEEKPVISGGEEDVANLVLRIAISQMIAERAGQQLSVLFLDEVFASLDLDRRDNVINLLHKLEDRFEQVVLITHIETIREGLDHVIRVDFDERTGSSLVREESPLIRESEPSHYFSSVPEPASATP
jgi:DNA repair protein SbcC/Rad50